MNSVIVKPYTSVIKPFGIKEVGHGLTRKSSSRSAKVAPRLSACTEVGTREDSGFIGIDSWGAQRSFGIKEVGHAEQPPLSLSPRMCDSTLSASKRCAPKASGLSHEAFT